MPPKMNQVWKALQEKMSNKRAQQGTRPRKEAKGTAAPSDFIVHRLTAEPDNKQTFRPVQPREFVEFSNDDLMLENLKIACAKYFNYPVGLCDVLVSNNGLYFFIFLFLICQQILFYFILLIFIAILFFPSLFSILVAYIFRFFPIFILFPSKTYIFYYDNAGPPYMCYFSPSFTLHTSLPVSHPPVAL